MKAWTTAEVDGACAFCGQRYRAGARVVVIQGLTWRKVYDDICAKRYHQMPDDTGELLDVTDAPSYPAPLKTLAAEALERFAPKPDDGFDFAKAAAKDED